jgi:hypothetical protein
MKFVKYAELRDKEPLLQQWESDAQSIGRNAKWRWYEPWLANYDSFLRLCREVAEEHRLSYHTVYESLLSGLVAVFEREWRNRK